MPARTAPYPSFTFSRGWALVAIQLGKDREKLDRAAFGEAYRRLIERFDDLMLRTHSQHPDCVRIWKRLYKHCDELFTFLDDPAVPADNNGTERDIRSLAAARRTGARTEPTGVPRRSPGSRA
jgi:hypothetical protein